MLNDAISNDDQKAEDWRALDNTNEYLFDEETEDVNIISHHLIESRGKLFLVREHRRAPFTEMYEYTRRVEVSDADANAGAWVPLPIGSGLGGGRALFVSRNSCKFIFAPCGNVEEDVVYILNTGEVFDMKSQKSRHGHFCRPHEGSAWLFPPELVL